MKFCLAVGKTTSPTTPLLLEGDFVESMRRARAMGYDAVEIHTPEPDQLDVERLRRACDELGIEIVATTDAKFKAEQQAVDLENVLALNPDIIICNPCDQTTMGEMWKEVNRLGIKTSFNDAVPVDLAEDEYTSSATSDAYGNGVAAGKIMARELGGKGKVAIFTFITTGPSIPRRTGGFRDYITKYFPEIEIVTEEGFTDPNKVSELADAVFAKHPDLDGAFAVWDVPAEGVMSSAKSMGYDDFVITTIDLGTNVARIIAEDGMIKGLGAQQPYGVGRAELLSAALACVTDDYPKYIVLEPVEVNKDNVADMWKEIYAKDAPEEVLNALKG